LIQHYPQVYRRVQTGYLFTFVTLAIWWLEAIFHSLVFFYGGVIITNRTGVLSSNGQLIDLVLFGNFVMAAAIITVLMKIALEVNYWTNFHLIGLGLSLLSYVLVLTAEDYFISSQEFIVGRMLRMPDFWFFLLLIPCICLLPDLIYKYIRRTYYPEDWQILQEMEILDQLPSLADKLRRKSSHMSKGKNSDSRGYSRYEDTYSSSNQQEMSLLRV